MSPYTHKAYSLVVSLILSLSLHANGIEQVSVSDLTGSLRDHQGEIRSKNIHIGFPFTQVDFRDFVGTFSTDHTTLTLTQDNTNLVIEDFQNSFFRHIGDLDIVKGNFQWRKNSGLFLNFQSANIKIGEGLQNFEDLHISCSALSPQKSNQDFLNPCLENGSFTIPLVDIDQVSQKTLKEMLITPELEGFLRESGANAQELTPEFLTPSEFRDIEVTTNMGELSLRARTRIIFNLTIRIDGELDHSRENGTLTFTLDRARIGIISFRRKLLKTLAKHGFEVRGNQVVFEL